MPYSLFNNTLTICSMISASEMEMGLWFMGQMAHHFWMGHRSLPLTNDHKITAQWIAIFLFLVDIKKLLTHSISHIIIAGDLILTYDFCSEDREGCPVTPCHGPPCPMRRGNDHGSWVTGHGSCGSWVNCVMGHMGHGSRKMTHFHL